MQRHKTCLNMTDVRAAIDAIDRDIVRLIGDRLHFIAEAARLKTDRGQIRDPSRIADVLAKIRATAETERIPPAFVEAFYRDLVERSIAHETALFDARADENKAG
jgi:isochorismate pyruvate lyase